MYKLELRGQPLKRVGFKNTIALTEAHNLRNIHAEFKTFNHIDRDRTSFNVEIVSLAHQTLEERVFSLITAAGLDLNSPYIKRKGKAYAIEWMFTTTHGYQCDFVALFTECLDWLANYYPTSPIAHAIIHFDEGDPHLHVVTVPIVGKKMPASRMVGYKGVSHTRNKDLYLNVGQKYGFTCWAYLKGAAKKTVSTVAINEAEKLSAEDFKSKLWLPLKQAIASRPEPFLQALNIPIANVLDKTFHNE